MRLAGCGAVYCTFNVLVHMGLLVAGCGLLHTRWLSNPLNGLAPLGPFKKVSKFSPKKPKKFAQKVPQKVPQKDFALRPGPYGESYFFVFPKLYPPGGVNPKKYFEDTHRYQWVAHAKFG